MIVLLFLLISTVSNAQLTNYQSLKAKLPIPLMGHITAVYNNHLFVFGGKNGSNNNDYIAFNDKFWKLPLSSITLETSDIANLVVVNEPSDNDWFQISVKPPTYGAANHIGIGSNTFVCEHQCSVLVDQYLYIFGAESFGSKNNAFINTVYRLDLSVDPPIFASQNDLYTSNLNNGKPFCVTVAMGNIYINTLFERIKFNPINDKLQVDTIKDTPRLNTGCASNSKQDKIYLLGGKNDSYWQGSFNIYDYTIGTNTNHSIESYHNYN
eukprot:525521_1